MIVQKFDEFLSEQIEDLKEYITTPSGLHWPLIAMAASEARSAINSVVETELQQQVAVRTAIAVDKEESKIELANDKPSNPQHFLEIPICACH